MLTSILRTSFIFSICLYFVCARSVITTDEKNEIGYRLSENELDVMGKSEAVNASAVCKCINGYCVEEKGKSICKCHPGWGLRSGLFIETHCKECECGKESNCTFDSSFSGQVSKKCVCKFAYEDVKGVCKGTCKKKPCQNGGKCSLKGDDVICKCELPFIGEWCQKSCDCGEYGQCSFDGENKICVCDEKYKEKNGMCEKCDCGEYGQCSFDGENKICICDEKFKEKNGICEIDYCQEICGDAEEVVCSGNKFEKESVSCTCSDSKKVFDKKVCKEMPVSTTPMLNSTRKTPPYTRHTTTKPTKMTSVKFSSTVLDITTPDPCSINPCRNGGICKADGYETRCYCIAPFTGEFCEDDPCTSSPCLNGGLCIINGTDFRCECRKPFYGRVCQKDPCSENPCQNQGTCFVVGKSIQCICKEPFAGNRCEVDPCMSWNPCKNGGVCKVVNNAVKCFCEKSYTGEFCDSRTGIDGTTIIFATISSLLVVILLFVSCILCQSVRLLKSS